MTAFAVGTIVIILLQMIVIVQNTLTDCRLGGCMAILDEINAKLDETIAEVSAQGTALDSLDTFVEGLFDQIRDLLAGQVPQEVLDKINLLATEVKNNTPKIQTAMEDGVEA